MKVKRLLKRYDVNSVVTWLFWRGLKNWRTMFSIYRENYSRPKPQGINDALCSVFRELQPPQASGDLQKLKICFACVLCCAHSFARLLTSLTRSWESGKNDLVLPHGAALSWTRFPPRRRWEAPMESEREIETEFWILICISSLCGNFFSFGRPNQKCN